MPWEHCAHTIRDDQVCPSCGITKETWTIDFAVPRTFKVARKIAGRFVTLDADAEGDVPIPGVAWRATLPGGATAEGETDEFGAARVPCDEAGEWTLELPEVAPSQLVRVSPDAEPADADRSGADGVLLRLSTATRYEVRLRPGLMLKVVHHGVPLAGRRYRLKLGDDEDTGTLDDDGVLRATIPHGVDEAELFVDDGDGGELHLVLPVEDLEPLDGVRGVQQRLTNLGFACAHEEEAGPRTAGALRSFQRKHGLEATGEIDEATRGKLAELHG